MGDSTIHGPNLSETTFAFAFLRKNSVNGNWLSLIDKSIRSIVFQYVFCHLSKMIHRKVIWMSKTIENWIWTRKTVGKHCSSLFSFTRVKTFWWTFRTAIYLNISFCTINQQNVFQRYKFLNKHIAAFRAMFFVCQKMTKSVLKYNWTNTFVNKA